MTPFRFRWSFPCVCILAIVSSRSFGQAVSPAPVQPPEATKPAADSPVELSPFEVRAENDVGYQAGNTVSGSRLNSRLKDTPASISPFTPEFLSDIGATNLQEMLAHATNVEVELEDSQAGFNNPPGRDATGGEYSFRIRGIVGGVSRDFVDATAPNDLYHEERAEMSSGPNSILFGLGPAGGLVSITGKKANVRRTRGTVKFVFAEHDYQRYELDYNVVPIRQRLGFRILGLHQTAETWRKWTRDDQDRLTGAITAKPFKHTTIDASYEKGVRKNSLQVTGNAVDSLSLWLNRSRPVVDGAAIIGTTVIPANADRFTLSGNTGVIYNLRGELESNSTFSSATLADVALAPNQINYIGPGGLRTNDFDSFNLNLEQRVIKDLVVVASLFHNRGVIDADGPTTSLPALRGDPNLNVPATTGGAGTVANPHRGQLYMESVWFKDFLDTTNDVARLSAAYEFKLGKWFGNHRLAGMVERSEQERTRRWRNEILVDANHAPITNANPDNGQNELVRRHYAAEGDWTTYYAGDPRAQVAPFTWNGRQIRPTFVSRPKGNAHSFKEIDSFMFAGQSTWFKERLITTLGYRLDDVTFRNEGEARVTDRNDPRVQSRQIVLNEWDFNGVYTVNEYKPKTITAGAVVHATKRLSFFYNMSESNGPPRFDRTVLPDGAIPPPVTGSGKDWGIMIDFLGDNRYFFRGTIYESDQLYDASVIPNGLTTNTAGALGGDNILAILQAFQNAGKITAAQYDAQAVTFNAGIIDLFTEGYELEFVANPTPNLTLRASYAYTERRRGNHYKEIHAYFDAKIPEWRALAGSDAALLALVNREIATVEGELDGQTTRQAAPFGTRPHKANFTGRYRFNSGWLKGAFAGGSVRYQGKNFVQTDTVTGRDYWGNEMIFADAFAGYRGRLMSNRLNYTVQLNVTNLTNSYLVGIGRYNTTFDGMLRAYLNPPRTYRLTTTIEF